MENYGLPDRERSPSLARFNCPREWVVTVFYPADPEANATPGPYAEEALNTAYADYSLTKESAGALDHIHSNAYWNAAANHSAGKFPSCFFSPAAASSPCFTQPCLSRSAVLVTLWSPFQNRLTPCNPLPDGRILPAIKWQNGANTKHLAKAMSGGETAMQEIMDKMKDNRAKDMIFALSQLEKINQDNPILADALDMEKVGVFGHSFGGASSVRGCTVRQTN
ncbi:hypothetical protein [Candidatus Villigracilis saccharophilus]|uniref:hypothetical protein n=1 Tax=Candidatus Villigracilis saccharophilus TaxID=3140684 RepID=UPI003136D69B|nr:hypothetical protein [Anaerolineales bacterium]